MNTKTTTLLTILALLVHIMNISAQSKPTLNIRVSAKIINRTAISAKTAMNFGTNLETNTTRGTVILDSNSSARNYADGLTGLKTKTQNTTNAAFEITGSSLVTYAITLPASITLTHTSIDNGTNTMDVTAIKTRFNGADSDDTASTFSENGTDSFTLGGKLNIEENQVIGNYSGSYIVSVDYN